MHSIPVPQISREWEKPLEKAKSEKGSLGMELFF